MLSKEDIEFCCKLFKGPVSVNHTGNDASIYFQRPYNGPRLSSVTQYMTLDQVIALVKETNEEVETSRMHHKVLQLDGHILAEELKYLTRSTRFSITDTPNEFIVSFLLEPNIDRILSKKADLNDVLVMVKSIMTVE